MSRKMTLILGGARSGKSSHAQRLAAECAPNVWYVATAAAGDEEMRRRIAAHQAERPAGWQTLEAQRGVGPALLAAAAAQPPAVVLLDCLTLLTSNILLAHPDETPEQTLQAALDEELDDLLTAYRSLSAEWFIVSNEVGLGLVPPYPLGRIYRDLLGRANQRLAQQADTVLFMVAGLPLKVKGD